MSKADVENIIKEAIKNNTELSEDKIDLNANLMTDLNISSLEIMVILAEIEEKCDIKINEDVLRDFANGNDIIKYICGEKNV